MTTSRRRYVSDSDSVCSAASGAKFQVLHVEESEPGVAGGDSGSDSRFRPSPQRNLESSLAAWPTGNTVAPLSLDSRLQAALLSVTVFWPVTIAAESGRRRRATGDLSWPRLGIIMTRTRRVATVTVLRSRYAPAAGRGTATPGTEDTESVTGHDGGWRRVRGPGGPGPVRRPGGVPAGPLQY
jgi:hypothetical protein